MRSLPAMLPAATLVAALATTAPGCGGPADGREDAPVASPAEVETARSIYRNESCAMCHGLEAEGTDMAPALADLAGYWDEDRLVRYLENPGAYRDANPSFDARHEGVYDVDMPSFDHVSDADRRSLARWLLGR